MSIAERPGPTGRPVERAEGRLKVTGQAPYAMEHRLDSPAYLFPLQATIAKGWITSIDASAASELDGVLAIVTHENALRFPEDSDPELSICQSNEIRYRGELIGAVVAETSEIARLAAGMVELGYDEVEASTRLDPHDPALYAPESVNAGFPTDTGEGDLDAAIASSDVVVDHTYTTPIEHNNPMEPHATGAIWTADGLELYDSTQGTHQVASTLAPMLGLEPEQVRVHAPYVGGGFGSKGLPHSNVVLAALAAHAIKGRALRFALTRQMMFDVAGYRTRTIQRMRLGARADGSIVAIGHDVVEQSSQTKEFAEQTAVSSRMMYSAAARRTTHRIAPLDVAVPSWMRAPGEAPGMFAGESAIDELAVELGIDPIDLRVRNDPATDPESGLPWSTRNLVACLREGAERIGWGDRDPAPRARREGEWLLGTGVAASTYPVFMMEGSKARVSALEGGRFTVEIAATDIGTGAWTVLAQIAADALGVELDRVEMRIGDSSLPYGSVAGGSSGTNSWGAAIDAAARRMVDEHGPDPKPGVRVESEAREGLSEDHSPHAFGAQFADVSVNAETGEVRVPRMVGVFAAGRIINPRLARSQLIGGMTMGLSMALFEESVLDERLGHIVSRDLADYHVPSNADIGEIDVGWIDEEDPHIGPLGAKGIGEIGIVGTAAALANAVFHATGIRVRDLPLTPDKLIS